MSAILGDAKPMYKYSSSEALLIQDEQRPNTILLRRLRPLKDTYAQNYQRPTSPNPLPARECSHQRHSALPPLSTGHGDLSRPLTRILENPGLFVLTLLACDSAEPQYCDQRPRKDEGEVDEDVVPLLPGVEDAQFPPLVLVLHVLIEHEADRALTPVGGTKAPYDAAHEHKDAHDGDRHPVLGGVDVGKYRAGIRTWYVIGIVNMDVGAWNGRYKVYGRHGRFGGWW